MDHWFSYQLTEAGHICKCSKNQWQFTILMPDACSCHLSAHEGNVAVVPFAFCPMPWEWEVIWASTWAARRCGAAGRSRVSSVVGQRASELCLTLPGGPVTQRNVTLGVSTWPSWLPPKTAEYLRGLYLYQQLLAEQFAQYDFKNHAFFLYLERQWIDYSDCAAAIEIAWMSLANKTVCSMWDGNKEEACI